MLSVFGISLLKKESSEEGSTSSQIEFLSQKQENIFVEIIFLFFVCRFAWPHIKELDLLTEYGYTVPTMTTTCEHLSPRLSDFSLKTVQGQGRTGHLDVRPYARRPSGYSEGRF